MHLSALLVISAVISATGRRPRLALMTAASSNNSSGAHMY